MRLLRLWRLSAAMCGYSLLPYGRPDRPRWLLPATVLLVVFALEPANFKLPILGIVDDLVV